MEILLIASSLLSKKKHKHTVVAFVISPKNKYWIPKESFHHKPLINSSSVMGFRTAFENPSWKLTQISRSCCFERDANLPVDCCCVEEFSMILPKKSRFGTMGFEVLASSTEPWVFAFTVTGSEFWSHGRPPPAVYLAWRISALCRAMYFWYSWSRAWRTAYLDGGVVAGEAP